MTNRARNLLASGIIAVLVGTACEGSTSKKDASTSAEGGVAAGGRGGAGGTGGGGGPPAGGTGGMTSPDASAGGMGGMAGRDAGPDAQAGAGGAADAGTTPDSARDVMAAGPDTRDAMAPRPDATDVSAPSGDASSAPPPDAPAAMPDAPAAQPDGPAPDAPAATSDAPATTPDAPATQPDGPAPDAPAPTPDMTTADTAVLGATCTSDSQCANGNCVDGVCCDQPAAMCNGCKACNVAGSVGRCTNVPQGMDPHNVCNLDIFNCKDFNCRGDGTCNRPAGAQCQPPSCSGGREFLRACSDNGVCTTVNRPCETCVNNKCTTSCETDRDCPSTHYCDTFSGSQSPSWLTCLPKKPNGGTCNEDGGTDRVCQSGNCQTGHNDMICACTGGTCDCGECRYINNGGTACEAEIQNQKYDCCQDWSFFEGGPGVCNGTACDGFWSNNCGFGEE